MFAACHLCRPERERQGDKIYINTNDENIRLFGFSKKSNVFGAISIPIYISSTCICGPPVCFCFCLCLCLCERVTMVQRIFVYPRPDYESGMCKDKHQTNDKRARAKGNRSLKMPLGVGKTETFFNIRFNVQTVATKKESPKHQASPLKHE